MCDKEKILGRGNHVLPKLTEYENDFILIAEAFH